MSNQMPNPRKAYGRADHISLASQVDGHCPICGTPLFYEKRGKKSVLYELAHIYPLNPTPAEASLLENEERLHVDVNHPDNLMALCPSCHKKFDHPRTIEEYRYLLGLKRKILGAESRRSTRQKFSLEPQIISVVEALCASAAHASADLSFDPKSLEEKLSSDVSSLLVRKIHNNVSGYFPVIRGAFLELERQSPGVSQLILSQVRALYLKLKIDGHPKDDIFQAVVDWIGARCGQPRPEAAEAIASFFVQNCEVFE